MLATHCRNGQPKPSKVYRDSIRTDAPRLDNSQQQPPSSPTRSRPNRRDGARTFRNRGRSEQGPRTLSPVLKLVFSVPFCLCAWKDLVRSSRRDFKHVSGLRKGTTWMGRNEENAGKLGGIEELYVGRRVFFVCNAEEGFFYNGPTILACFIRHG